MRKHKVLRPDAATELSYLPALKEQVNRNRGFWLTPKTATDSNLKLNL